MAYKKYIMRNGKLYGPYLYHSRRVNGKVISEYQGIDRKPFNFRKFIFIALGVFLLAGFIYGLVSSRNKITSNVILDMKADYREGEILNGFFKISLNEGELIPADSKIVFENLGTRYEYNLKDVVSDAQVEGDFYVREKSLSGSGLGYGIPGKKTIYSPVEFTLRIYSKINSENPGSGNEESADENVSEESVEEAGENQVNETEAIPEKIPGETPAEQQEILEEPQQIPGEFPEEEPAGGESANEENPANAEAAITGGIVSSFFGSLFNGFQGIIKGRITGRASSEIFAEIQGEVSEGKPFTYNLEAGQDAEIISSSHSINMKIENNLITVTTDYFEDESGFGEDYAGDSRKTISIDLSELNLSLEKGELDTYLIYEGEEILSSNIILEEGEIEVKKEILNNSFQEESFDALTEQEKGALKSEFGNFSVRRTAKLFRDRIIIKYELGEKWIENSYDAADISENELKILTEESRIRWFKDIAAEILRKETPSEELGEFQETISFDSAGF